MRLVCRRIFSISAPSRRQRDRRLEDALRSRGSRELPAPPAHWSRPATGSLVGRLEIPRLRLSAIVLEGSDSRTLDLGVGRIPETAEPGESGNVVLSGHRDTFFRPLRGIRTGDRIAMVTRGGSYRYVVDWTAVVDPADTATLKPTPGQVANPGHLLPVPLCRVPRRNASSYVRGSLRLARSSP